MQLPSGEIGPSWSDTCDALCVRKKSPSDDDCRTPKGISKGEARIGRGFGGGLGGGLDRVAEGGMGGGVGGATEGGLGGGLDSRILSSGRMGAGLGFVVVVSGSEVLVLELGVVVDDSAQTS